MRSRAVDFVFPLAIIRELPASDLRRNTDLHGGSAVLASWR